MINIGKKIRSLRTEREISQETLAGYLGVSFQAVSKWETGAALPDVTLIPAIAAFFGVSTDEIFDFNVYEIEREVKGICDEAYKYRFTDCDRSEKILRDGLRRFPGNETILNNLLYVLDFDNNTDEAVSLCLSLIEGAKSDEVKYDACRILAYIYKKKGEEGMVKATLDMIPEIYFSRLSVSAELLEGKERYRAAVLHKSISFYDTVEMCEILADIYAESGETDKARGMLEMALDVLRAAHHDHETEYTRSLYDEERIAQVEKKLKELQ